MSEDHVGNLQKLRAQLVVARRQVAVELIGPHDCEKLSRQDNFMAAQATLEAVDRALADEKTAATKGQYSRESR
jgi:hypothetical protein